MPDHSVAEVAENFEAYAARVAEEGESLVVTRDGQPYVEVRPARRGCTVAEFIAMIPHLPYVDDDDREQFARDLEAAHEHLNSLPLPPDPWES